MKKSCRFFTVYILCISIVLSMSIFSFAETLPAPTWIKIVTNKDDTKTVVIETPSYMLENIDYYEFSTDGGGSWTVLESVSGVEILISRTCDVAVRYTKDNVTSSPFRITVEIKGATAVTSPSTGITLLISHDSSIPTDVTLAAYEIVNGADYIALKEKFGKNKPFTMYSVKIMRNNSEYVSEETKTWLFPLGDYSDKYTNVYHIDGSGKMKKISADTEMRVLYFTTQLTGTFVIVEDKTYCKGDANGDAAITPSDARLALRAAARLETLNILQFYAADVDNDNKVTAADSRIILQASAGIIKLENL